MNVAPTATTTPSSTMSATPTPAPTTATTTPALTTTVQIALVDEIGVPSATTFGCGDKIEMVNRPVSTTTPLQTAINELLSVNTRNYGMSGLTSALYQDNFTLVSATITGSHATINLTGSTSQDGACDSPRIQEQMKRTILQFPSITTYDILLNGSVANWNALFSGA
ncbi:GerMN domain-containing protein [Candidatus Gracilibacteria bacterium]|nr:GerMN domain-containing protein [Candidatus Gracilibacteria bacterium]